MSGARDTASNIDLQAPKRGFIKTGSEIVKRETALGLYKGLGAVLTGIVPKMAIRFTSYEFYKQMLADKDGIVTSKSTFLGMSILLRRQLFEAGRAARRRTARQRRKADSRARASRHLEAAGDRLETAYADHR